MYVINEGGCALFKCNIYAEAMWQAVCDIVWQAAIYLSQWHGIIGTLPHCSSGRRGMCSCMAGSPSLLCMCVCDVCLSVCERKPILKWRHLMFLSVWLLCMALMSPISLWAWWQRRHSLLLVMAAFSIQCRATPLLFFPVLYILWRHGLPVWRMWPAQVPF